MLAESRRGRPAAHRRSPALPSLLLLLLAPAGALAQVHAPEAPGAAAPDMLAAGGDVAQGAPGEDAPQDAPAPGPQDATPDAAADAQDAAAGADLAAAGTQDPPAGAQDTAGAQSASAASLPDATAPAPAEPPALRTVVTATRGRPIGTSAAASSVLLPREVQAAPARTPDDVLRGVPGVLLPRADSHALHPTGQGLALRGIGRGRTLVLLDGLPLNDAFGGWVQWNKVAKSQVERVEVVRGASSSLYGSLAMGGVVQLFTRPTRQPRLLLEADLGTQRSPHIGVFGAVPVGAGLSLSASADTYRTDGHHQLSPGVRGAVDVPAEYGSRNANLRATWERGGWTAFAGASHFREERSAGTALTQNARWANDVQAGAAGALGGGRLEVAAFGGQQRLRNGNSRVDAVRASEVPVLRQDIPVHHAGGSVVWSRPLGARQGLVTGVDVRWVRGTNAEQVFGSTGAPLGERAAAGRQALGGLFAEWSVQPVERLTLTAGARADAWWNFAGRQVATDGAVTHLARQRDTALSPRVSAVLRVAEGLALRGAASTGFRAPNLNELYRGFFSGQVLVQPNPELGPERLRGGELGADWAPRPGLQLGLTAYADRTSDRIEQVTLDATTRQRRNIAQADSAGGELEAAWRPLPLLRLHLAYALALTRVVRFPENAALEGKRLAGIPRHAGALTASWSKREWLDATVRVRAESAQFADDLNVLTLPGFALVDVTLSRKLRDEVELYASASNVFDRRVLTEKTQTLERLGAPRSVWAGFRVRY